MTFIYTILSGVVIGAALRELWEFFIKHFVRWAKREIKKLFTKNKIAK